MNFFYGMKGFSLDYTTTEANALYNGWTQDERAITPNVKIYGTVFNENGWAVPPRFQNSYPDYGSGAFLDLGQEEVISFDIEESICGETDFSVGNFVSNTINLALSNAEGTMDSVKFVGRYIIVFATSTAGGVVSKQPLGHFVITESKKELAKKQINLKGVDLLTYTQNLKFQRIYGTGIILSDNGSTLRTILNLVQVRMGLITGPTQQYEGQPWVKYSFEDVSPTGVTRPRFPTYYRNTVNDFNYLPNYNVELGNDIIDTHLNGKTIREVVTYVAAWTGTNAIMDRHGHLQFRKLASDYPFGGVAIIGSTQHYGVEMEEEDTHPIVGVRVMAMNNEIAEAVNIGYKGRTLLIDDNPLIQDFAAAQQCANIVYANLNGYKYRPYTMRMRGYPCFESGDKIAIRDNGSGNPDTQTFIENCKISYAGGFRMEFSARGTVVAQDVPVESESSGSTGFGGDPVRDLEIAIGGASVKATKVEHDALAAATNQRLTTVENEVAKEVLDRNMAVVDSVDAGGSPGGWTVPRRPTTEEITAGTDPDLLIWEGELFATSPSYFNGLASGFTFATNLSFKTPFLGTFGTFKTTTSSTKGAVMTVSADAWTDQTTWISTTVSDIPVYLPKVRVKYRITGYLLQSGTYVKLIEKDAVALDFNTFARTINVNVLFTK